MAETYTLEAARHELAKQECAAYGHRWQIIEAYDRGPVSLICNRCGRSHPIGEADIESDPNYR